ncbi:MAG: hypothetical protein F4112_15980 [Holophagales bacterium]|nr:hypothetical protein [Holophagales bacterium]MYB20861.1 hypothetical protein [Holophagales bacterium]MYD21994.1 hypothetical protein [Holophagales bacterium]MYH25501.1 hypothetical protein [Holophagales bacterium]MYI34447.1 hypothetical protein [Holophagales bacterium]
MTTAQQDVPRWVAWLGGAIGAALPAGLLWLLYLAVDWVAETPGGMLLLAATVALTVLAGMIWALAGLLVTLAGR